MNVPILSIIFMIISAAIQIGVPVCLFIWFYKKYGAKFLPLIFGILGFVIFALILEGTIHRFVIPGFSLREKPVVYIIYGIFMAGIFEETARFIAFNILKKMKYGGIGTAIAYGVGHGGIEAVLLAGITMIGSVVVSIFVNTGNIGMLTNNLQGDTLTTMNSQISALVLTAPYMFLVSGLERLMAICIQVSLSVIVFYSVYNKKISLFLLAILLHAICDISAAMFQAGIIKSIFVVEGLVLISAAAMALLAKFVHDREKLKPSGNDGNNIQDN
jgi:uncharacterized membrane protein YhfC